LGLAVAVFGAGAWLRARARNESYHLENMPFHRIGTGHYPPLPAKVPADLAEGFRFEDVTEAMGIRFRWELPSVDPKVQEWVRQFVYGAGVAIADFDGDGWMDILLVNSKAGAKSHLYLNQHGKGFVEAGEAWGISDLSRDMAPISATVFDFDNDGKPDLYIGGLGCSKLLRNTGARFVDVTKGSGLGDCRNASGAVPIDFDGDGKLDLFVLRDWPALDYFHLDTFLIVSEDNVDSRNGGEKTLYRNRGDGTFEDVTKSNGVADSHWTLDGVAGDFLGDGRMRIYLANDFGPDKLFTADEGHLVDDSVKLGLPDRRFGMGVSLGDLSGDGTPHLHVSNEWITGYEQHGNFLWKFDENGRARDEAIERGTLNCGWAWGSAFADFELDGREDLYVANGFISGNSEKQFVFPMMTANTQPGIITRDVRTWPKIGDGNMVGHEIGCLFHNLGDRFENVAPWVGLTEDWDGRAVGLFDFDNNGSEDLIITTLNGPPHLLKNGVAPEDHWISFLLEGTRSNRDAVGARVEVSQGTRKWYRWATGGRTGLLASSDPRLHFGIPSGGSVDVVVRWPSGASQTFKNLSAGHFYKVREGEEPTIQSGS
jgi:hypothetical protein